MTMTERQTVRCTRPGFTLWEVLIAMAIIGGLMAVIVPQLFNYLERSKRDTAKTTLLQFKQAITLYQTDTGRLPDSLRDLIKRPTGEESANWSGPYLPKKAVPLDPWGRKFVYKPTPEAENPYELYSRGKSGKKEDWIYAP
ncbi:MAG TPA: type II secretion system major pseudopilin GspG [Candidatus Dependentiae bacterium]|nr:type II secretion system major pseudopilin GspG [Candidatus Dependentiae bacterium]HRQ63041.1 type II secretion system major pseudopilin GspG [Candidatus Dependentiae bacterium]